jgi:hypothetical protein
MSNVHISTTSVLKDKVSGNKHLIKHDLPVENTYAAMTGIFPGMTKSLSDMIESESTIAYNSFYGNGEDLKNNYDTDNYVEIVDLNNNDELKTIIEKTRDFIDKNKKGLAKEFNDKHPGLIADLDTKVEDLPTTYKYEDFSDNDKAREKMTNVNKLAEIVFKVLTNSKYVATDPTITFDRTVVISIDELNVLIPKYYNSFVYIVGQGFNVFSPPGGAPPNISFYEKFDRLLADMPRSLIFSFGNRELMVKSFFESSDMKVLLSGFGTSNKKEENKGYYVGGLDGSKQKQGAGVVRWNNGNVFEGTFANDAIVEGDFTEFGIGVPHKLKMTNAIKGDATLDGVMGIFDSVDGVFVSTGSSSSTSASPVSSTVASPVSSTVASTSASTIVAVPTTSASTSASSSSTTTASTTTASTTVAVPNP